MEVEPRIGFVDANVVAQHHQVDKPVEAGIGKFAVLDIFETVAQYTYIISVRAQVREDFACSFDERSLLGQTCEVEWVELSGDRKSVV